MGYVILGVDPGENALGVGAVDLDGRNRRCWTVDISEKHRPSMPHRFQRIRAAFVELMPEIGRPAILVVENSTFASTGKAQAFQWGGIVADVVREVATIWPTLHPDQVWDISPPGWKSLTGVKSIHHTVQKDAKKRRQANLELTAGRAIRVGFDVPRDKNDRADYDAAAGGLIALWGFMKNEQQLATTED